LEIIKRVKSPGDTSHDMPVMVRKGAILTQHIIDKLWLASQGAYAQFGTAKQVERQGPQSLRDNPRSRNNLFLRGMAGNWELIGPEDEQLKRAYNESKSAVPGSQKKKIHI
jgi:hypothetical protein